MICYNTPMTHGGITKCIIVVLQWMTNVISIISEDDSEAYLVPPFCVRTWSSHGDDVKGVNVEDEKSS